MPLAPDRNRGPEVNVCSAVSYFSARKGSIIGADRLSFRVRDGTGRFPVAMTAVTLFSCRRNLGGFGSSPRTSVFGGGVRYRDVVAWLRARLL